MSDMLKDCHISAPSHCYTHGKPLETLVVINGGLLCNIQKLHCGSNLFNELQVGHTEWIRMFEWARKVGPIFRR